MDNASDKPEALRIMPKTIEASCYNHVRLALRRIENPYRVGLPDHRNLEMILDNAVWLCVDSAAGDMPIMAWMDFDTRKHNDALHAPVPCNLHLYHTLAGLVMGSVLESLEEVLTQELLLIRR